MTKFVLSIAGGGSRGIIPVILLHELYKLTHKHPSLLFDAFIGTSTGGIISLLLTCNNRKSTNDLINFYTGEPIKKIFKKNIFNFPFNAVKYQSKNIESVLKDKFCDEKISDAIKPTIVTTYDMKNKAATFINSTESKYKNMYTWECARATSAAPTYFEPFNYNDNVFIDGGIFANNPAIVGYIEAKKIFPNDKIIMVHFGTGYNSNSNLSKEKINKFNLLDWAKNILDFIFDGQSDTSEYAIKRLLPEEDIFIFNPNLGDMKCNLDNINADYLQKLIDLTLEYINKEDIKQQFNKLIALLQGC